MILSNHKIRLDKDVTFHESFRVGDSVIDFERNYVNIDASIPSVIAIVIEKNITPINEIDIILSPNGGSVKI